VPGDCSGVTIMVTRVEESWAALETRGFVVVREFLSSGDLMGLEAAYRQAQRAEVAAYVALQPERESLFPVLRRVRALLQKVREAAVTSADTVVEQGVFFATEMTKLGWHSDSKSYYTFQSHRDHLSFWLPIIKPRADKSGLSVVPMDALRDRAGDIFRLVEGRGAARYEDGFLYYEAGSLDRRIRCPIDLDEISEAPALAPGDVLVMRSDLLHRTQDADTPRVSLALRALPGDQLLTLSALLSGSAGKHERMLREPSTFCETLAAFSLYRRSHMTAHELLEAQQRLARKEFVPRLAFAAARLLLPALLLGQGLRRRSSP
jgi:hypothetical protein